MRRWTTLLMLAGLIVGLGGCTTKEKAVTEEAAQTDAKMQSPEMKEWYKENANKQPADTATDAMVTDGSATPTAPAPAAGQ